MPSLSTIFASVAGLSAVSSVAAAPAGTKPLSSRQHPTECGHGTWWYDCANGYKGCYGYDVCALPPVSGSATTLVTMTVTSTTTTSVANAPTSTTTTSSVWLHKDVVSSSTTSTSASTSTTTSGASTTSAPISSSTLHVCPPAGSVAKVFKPTMYDISPNEPDTAKIPSQYLEIQSETGYPQHQQVAIFRDIPSTAKSCSLKWNQAKSTQRHFFTSGNAALRAWPITSAFPAAGTDITYNTVQGLLKAQGYKPFDPTDKTTSDPATRQYSNPDLTFWDTLDIATTFDFVAEIDCAKDIAVYIELDVNPNLSRAEGRVLVQQDAINGVSLEYTC